MKRELIVWILSVISGGVVQQVFHWVSGIPQYHIFSRPVDPVSFVIEIGTFAVGYCLAYFPLKRALTPDRQAEVPDTSGSTR